MIVTVAEFDLLVSSVDVAVIVAVPAVALVNSPDVLTVPALDGLTLHVTAELKLPVPCTVAVHCDVCPVWIDRGAHESLILVIVGVCAVPLLPPPEGAAAPAAPPHAAQTSRRKMDTTVATPVRAWEGFLRAILTSSIYEERAPNTSQ